MTLARDPKSASLVVCLQRAPVHDTLGTLHSLFESPTRAKALAQLEAGGIVSLTLTHVDLDWLGSGAAGRQCLIHRCCGKESAGTVMCLCHFLLQSVSP